MENNLWDTRLLAAFLGAVVTIIIAVIGWLIAAKQKKVDRLLEIRRKTYLDSVSSFTEALFFMTSIPSHLNSAGINFFEGIGNFQKAISQVNLICEVKNSYLINELNNKVLESFFKILKLSEPVHDLQFDINAKTQMQSNLNNRLDSLLERWGLTLEAEILNQKLFENQSKAFERLSEQIKEINTDIDQIWEDKVKIQKEVSKQSILIVANVSPIATRVEIALRKELGLPYDKNIAKQRENMLEKQIYDSLKIFEDLV